MNFTEINSSGEITLGTPGTLSGTTTNAVSSTSHTHAITTAAVTDNGTDLADGNQIYDFVTGLGYTSNTGTMSSWIIKEGNGTETATVVDGETLTLAQGTGIQTELILQ